MTAWQEIDFALGVAPVVVMLIVAGWARVGVSQPPRMWHRFHVLAISALVLALAALGMEIAVAHANPATVQGFDGWLAVNLFGSWVSVLVQFLGVAIGIYSSKHLQGEPRQRTYVSALAAVLAAVHVLLLANHWIVLIAAWAVIQWAMHDLLVFYRNRPFALLAAHKKMVTDRAVDILLIVAAILAWVQIGSGSLSDLWAYIDAGHSSPLLVWSGVCVALAVIARTALMPVHGWLVQVMEAPTPVSALLHAGVVNLGGYVLVLFAPLLDIAPAAHWLLVVFGLMSAVVAGLVLLTRVSQKVHLAWSTIAQMGFMLLECGLGLYLFAALHLMGHSLYKAHNFLNASSAVQETSRKLITDEARNSGLSMLIAIPIALAVVFGLQWLMGHLIWPWWWSAVLAFAWAPLLWVPKRSAQRAPIMNARMTTALAMVIFLTVITLATEYVPMGAALAPRADAGIVAFIGMALMYLEMAVSHLWPHRLVTLRRWVYAGFYMDEGYTHWVLRLWPTHWAGAGTRPSTVTARASTHAPSDS